MPVYLDHAATTPMRPELLDGYLAQLQVIGNPSSVHSSGQGARRALEDSRDQLATALDCHRSEVLFTSGGTESNNLAIKGLFLKRNGLDSNRTLIITAGTEHHAGIDPIEWLEATEGAEAIWAPVDSFGVIDLQWLEVVLAESAERVALISLMWVNNETGLITPIAEITALAAKYGIPVHSDAVAAFGHVPVSFKKSGLATMAISGHKFGAPVGIGAIVVARDAKLAITSHGGGQERGIRSGTLSAPLAYALGEAAALAELEREEVSTKLEKFKEQILQAVYEIAPDALFTRGEAPGFSGIIHFTFPGCSGDSLLFLLDTAGVSVSTGSACRAGVAQASHVIMAMGRTEDEAKGSLRISLGYNTTQLDVDAFIAAFPSAYQGALKAGLPTK
jgi:cysteine desulfurase